MTNRCVILSAAPTRDPFALTGYLLPDDYIVAADGGWQLALQMGVKPALLVADFDSLGVPSLPEGVECVSLPTEKDVTDTMLACEYARDNGCSYITIVGGFALGV